MFKKLSAMIEGKHVPLVLGIVIGAVLTVIYFRYFSPVVAPSGPTIYGPDLKSPELPPLNRTGDEDDLESELESEGIELPLDDVDDDVTEGETVSDAGRVTDDEISDIEDDHEDGDHDGHLNSYGGLQESKIIELNKGDDEDDDDD